MARNDTFFQEHKLTVPLPEIERVSDRLFQNFRQRKFLQYSRCDYNNAPRQFQKVAHVQSRRFFAQRNDSRSPPNRCLCASGGLSVYLGQGLRCLRSGE